MKDHLVGEVAVVVKVVALSKGGDGGGNCGGEMMVSAVAERGVMRLTLFNW